MATGTRKVSIASRFLKAGRPSTRQMLRVRSLFDTY
jgi:hypothetical protein